jgi:putative membrane protein insertion efficiency factor
VNRAMTFVVLMPRNLVVLLLKGYRAVISPLYGDVCRYYPSCSHYTLQAVQQHGLGRGAWLGVRRIARCHPWAEGGIDDVPAPRHQRYSLTRSGFAVPATAIPQSHGKG